MNNKKYVIKNSLGMFDFFKGIVMILVVISHTEGLGTFLDEYSTPAELFSNVNIIVLLITFILLIFGQAAMPAMFLISGYGFRKTSNKKCIVKQFQTILIPFVTAVIISTIIHIPSYLLLFKDLHYAPIQTLGVFLGGLLGLTTDRYFHGFRLLACGPIWYLIALAIALVIYNFLANHFEGYKLFLSSVLVMLIGWIMSFKGPLPWSASQAFIAVFYLWLGHYIKRNKLLVSPLKKSYGILVAIIVIIVIIGSGGRSAFAMALDSYPVGPLSIVAYGLLGAVIIKGFLHLNQFNGVIVAFIRKIGRYSFYFLCVHSIEMVAVGSYLQYKFVHEWWNGDPAIRSAIILGIRIPFAIIVTFAFVRIREMMNKQKL